MNICPSHWDALRSKIDDLGLTEFVSESGMEAAAKTMDQITKVEPDDSVTRENFDPLMGAYWLILVTTTRFIGENAPSALFYLFDPSPPWPIDFTLYRNGSQVEERLRKDGIEPIWPKCPLCYLGLMHELICEFDDTVCSLDTIDGYKWMIEKAGNDQYEEAVELGLREA